MAFGSTMRKKGKIAAVISFCTNDYRFLHPCIQGIKPCVSQIIVPVSDHFYDGTKENLALLSRAYNQHPECEFVQFSYDPKTPYGYTTKRQGDLDWPRYWHSTARMIGYHFLRKDIDYALFIDVDEIYDGKAFKQFLQEFDYSSFDALRFRCYSYFREAHFRAKESCVSGLMVRKEALNQELLLDIDERMGTFKAIQGKKIIVDDPVMIHHYSWVRTKEEMLRKVSCWAHFWEKDWKSLIEKEFSGPFQGKDFTTDMEYIQVDPLVNLFEERPLPQHSNRKPHYITPKDIFRKNIRDSLLDN
jgi:hypothetical protein